MGKPTAPGDIIVIPLSLIYYINVTSKSCSIVPALKCPYNKKTPLSTAGKIIKFHTGGTTASEERMQIDGLGNVGIATTTPNAKLDVEGTFKLGTAGTVLSNVIKTNASITENITTLSYAVTTRLTATVTGAALNGNLVVNPRTALPNGMIIVYSRISAANTIEIGVVNPNGGFFGTVVFDVTVFN